MDFRKLKGRIYEKYGSISAFARALGRSRQAVDFKLRGRSDFTKKDMDTWMSMLDIKTKEVADYFFIPNVTKS